jgi:hypothetical protein
MDNRRRSVQKNNFSGFDAVCSSGQRTHVSACWFSFFKSHSISAMAVKARTEIRKEMKSKNSHGKKQSSSARSGGTEMYYLLSEPKVRITNEVIRELNQKGRISLGKKQARQLDRLLEEISFYFQTREIDRLDSATKNKLRSFKGHARQLIGLSIESAEWFGKEGRSPEFSAAVHLDRIFEDIGQSFSHTVRILERAITGIDRLLAERSRSGRPNMETYLLDVQLLITSIYMQAGGKSPFDHSGGKVSVQLNRLAGFTWELLKLIKDDHRLAPRSEASLRVWLRDQVKKGLDPKLKLKLVSGRRRHSSSASSSQNEDSESRSRA